MPEDAIDAAQAAAAAEDAQKANAPVDDDLEFNDQAETMEEEIIDVIEDSVEDEPSEE